MVYPVSGGAQQIPAANTFQPGGQTTNIKNPERENRTDSVQLSGTETKTIQKSEVFASTERSQDTGGVSASSSRGTSLDISV